MTKLHSEFVFLPLVHLNTKIYYYKEDYTQSGGGLLSGGLFYNALLKNKYYVDTDSPAIQGLPDKSEEGWKIGWEIALQDNDTSFKFLSTKDLDVFIADTDDLIRLYGKPKRSKEDFLNSVNLTHFARYCEKYGVPFIFPNRADTTNAINHYNGHIPYWALVNIFEDMYLHLHWKDIFNVTKLTQSIIAAAKLANSLNYDSFELIFLGNQKFDESDNHYIYNSGISWYVMPSNRDISTSTLIYKKLYPNFKIVSSGQDLLLLNEISDKDKLQIIENNLMENIVNLLNIYPPKHHFSNGKILSFSNSPLLLFLLNTLMNKQTKFCKNPKCGKIITTGNDYCNTKCKEVYHNSTSEGKLRILTTKWKKRYNLQNEDILKIQQTGIEMIEKGQEWTQVLKESQRQLKLLKAGEK